MDWMKVINYALLSFMACSLAWAAFLWIRETYRARFAKTKDVEIIFVDSED